MQTQLLNYHATLQSLINRGDANEHSFRTAFENLLNAFKPTQTTPNPNSEQGEIVIIHEPKSTQGQGSIRPDFKVIRKAQGYESLVGFIECKNFGVDLSPLVRGKQIEKYLSVCHNIILTDYNRFILLSYGKIIDDLVLFPNGFEENLLTKDSTPTKAHLIESSTRIAQLLGEFFHTSAQIAQKDDLIKVLSSQSFYLSSTIFSAFSTQDLESHTTNSNAQEFQATFSKSYQSFRDLESADISEIEFCDIVAQSIVYGAFVAHIESENYEIDKIPTEMFVALLPRHFVTLREFIESSLPARNLPDSITYALSNIIKTIALIDKPSIATSFQKEISEVSIYLYEDFLKAFDDLRGEQKRKEGGVFYTPEPIVSMIVRSIDELLGKHFGKNFIDENVKVLDFATGTGSFLAKVFDIILSNQSEVFAKNVIINKCFKDIYGFEMSFVPYIVAHLKLSSLLRAKGFSEFSAHQKFQVYLTNTLDLDVGRQIYLQVPFDTLKNERDKSLELKHKEDLLVILGNPPYNVKSKNKGAEILELLQSYKQGLKETKINLDDDYIKFIRFAQWKLIEQKQQSGIMGFITNNSFLFGRTHRKMRQSLAKTFDEIYILNLHGDSGENKNDKNVFDIRVGVCISIFVKYQNSPSLARSNSESSPSLAEGDKGGGYNLAQIHYFSTKDNEILRRADKFSLLNDIAQNGLDSIKWQNLKLDSPYFWFVPKDFSNAEYENFWALAKNKALGESKSIFEVFNSGVDTNVDKYGFVYGFNTNQIYNAIDNFTKMTPKDLRLHYKIDDTKSRDWKVEWAKADVISSCSTSLAELPFSTSPSLARSNSESSPSLAEGARGWVKTDKSQSHRQLKPYMKEFSREMRKNPTDAENKLWQELRGKKLGFRFRRQFVIDSKYIADFVCLEKRLIIECDGGQHNQNFEDIERDFYLESQNFRILRFWNNEILENLEGVLLTIKNVLESDFANAKSTHPLTPSAREGEQKATPSAREGDSLSSLQTSEANAAIQKKIITVAYRPFDLRYTFYTGTQCGFMANPRKKVLSNLLPNNIGICFTKDSDIADNFLVSPYIIDSHLLAGKAHIAPLYLYPDEFLQGDKTPNFTQEFSAFIAKHKVLKNKTPEQILAFIYANLYNPAYRAKYLEYLKIGFPRIDFDIGESQFEKYANLGQNLIDLHLTKTIPQDKEIDLKFRESADKSSPNFTLDKPKYEPNLNKIILNADLEIIGISQEVWDYTIGGYKVLDKWLKYRANDKNGAITLSQADFTHILNVAKILKATIAIQRELGKI